MKKMFQEKDIYKDRQSQIDAIEGSFEAAKKPVRMNNESFSNNFCKFNFRF